MLAPPTAPVQGRPAAPPTRPPGDQRPPQPRRAPRWRRIALLAAALCLVPAVVSYGKMLTQASNAGIGIRTVEWLRDNGARGIVNKVESIYYSLNAPSTGGPALRALPKQVGVLAAANAARQHRVHYYRPPRIRPLTRPALPGEGVWRATFSGRGSRPPVLVTSFRSDPVNYPQLVAGVAWIDHSLTSTWLYPGRLEPGVSMGSRGPLEVPLRLRPKLVATFNSGFKLTDSGGGFADAGHTYAPLKSGIGTFVRYRDGHVDVVSWNGGPNATPDDSVRPPEPAADRRSWPAQPQPLRRPGVGRDPRQRRPRVAFGGGRRPLWQPDLCRRGHPNGRVAGGDHDPCEGGARDGAGHQRVLDQLHHLPRSRRDRPGEPPRFDEPPAESLPDAGRPRLLRGVHALSYGALSFCPRSLPLQALAAACVVCALAAAGCGGSSSPASSSSPTVQTPAPSTSAPTSTSSASSTTTTATTATVLQRPEPKPPHRPYAVLTRVVTFVDPSRTIQVPGGGTEARRLVTVIRYPAGARGRLPVVIFGHGFAVTPAPYAALLRAWARAGYIVAAPIFPLENADAPGGPNESDLINQPQDMSFVITRLEAMGAQRQGFLAGMIDYAGIAVSGQSDGGETALGVAYDRHFLDRRVSAAVILSGAVIPGVGGFDFPAPSPPLLATQGTADTINPPSFTSAFFDVAPPPKYLLTMFGAPHLGPYTDEQPQLGIVERVTIAFLDRYLRGVHGALHEMAIAGNVSGVSALQAYS